MKIIENRPNKQLVRFSQLSVGDCFKFVGAESNNHLFLKIDVGTSSKTTFDTEDFNAFDLSDDLPCAFASFNIPDLLKVDVEIVTK